MNRITIEKNEKFLRQKSIDFNFKDKSFFKVIKELENYCINNKVFSMAAVQIGFPVNIIYLKTTDQNSIFEKDPKNEARVLINPKIIYKKGKAEYWEACESCLENFALVERPYEVLVEFFDVDGNKKQQVYKGFETTVLLHEIDHLNGILHMDRAKILTQMSQKDRILFRKDNPYKIISKDCNFDYEENIKK